MIDENAIEFPQDNFAAEAHRKIPRAHKKIKNNCDKSTSYQIFLTKDNKIQSQ